MAADKVENKAATIRQVVEDMIRESGKRGMIASEAFASIDAGETTIRPRFAELYKQGVIVKTETLRENHRGNSEHVYKHKENASPDELQYSIDRLLEESLKHNRAKKIKPIGDKDLWGEVMRSIYAEAHKESEQNFIRRDDAIDAWVLDMKKRILKGEYDV